MDFIDDIVSDYLNQHCDSEPALLQKINRETHLTQSQSHMISGHYQGRLLSMISKMLRPKRILEIGTYTGYAAISLAEGLRADGELHTIDRNDELQDRVQAYFDESGYGQQIHYHIGEATDVISRLDGTFDLVFIDADKKNNLRYFEMMMDRTESGAVILIDNVLWKGRVLQENPDKQTKEILDLNKQLTADPRVEKIILPVRDGIFMLRKV